MKDTRHSHDSLPQNPGPAIPELDIIDLEGDGTLQAAEEPDSSQPPRKKPAGGILSRINVHIVLLAVFLLFIGCIVYKFLNWGVEVDLDEIFKDGPGEYSDIFDVIVPLTDGQGKIIYPDYEDGITILAFGNAPFADDRGSKDNLTEMIQELSGATVYNCSISGSYLASQNPTIDPHNYPWDVFTFYWMCLMTTEETTRSQFLTALDTLGENAPPEGRDVYDTLCSIDMNEVDVITVMYDGSDYLLGHKMFDDDKPTDIEYFTGNLTAGIELLQQLYPHIRIIVLSPTYAFGLDEEGNYVSSDLQRYGQDVLSTYVIKQGYYCNISGITFVDNLYGTIHEDNAREYLSDHIHLNVEGRKKVAERFVYALNYFDDMQKKE